MINIAAEASSMSYCGESVKARRFGRRSVVVSILGLVVGVLVWSVLLLVLEFY